MGNSPSVHAGDAVTVWYDGVPFRGTVQTTIPFVKVMWQDRTGECGSRPVVLTPLDRWLRGWYADSDYEAAKLNAPFTTSIKRLRRCQLNRPLHHVVRDQERLLAPKHVQGALARSSPRGRPPLQRSTRPPRANPGLTSSRRRLAAEKRLRPAPWRPGTLAPWPKAVADFAACEHPGARDGSLQHAAPAQALRLADLRCFRPQPSRTAARRQRRIAQRSGAWRSGARWSTARRWPARRRQRYRQLGASGRAPLRAGRERAAAGGVPA